MANPIRTGPDPKAAYLRTGEAAERLHVRQETVTRWVNAGKLPSVKTVGGHNRIPAPAVDALIAELAADDEARS